LIWNDDRSQFDEARLKTRSTQMACADAENVKLGRTTGPLRPAK
jgi:hypothetical protein